MSMGEELEYGGQFARTRSASDGMECATDVAEDKDLVYLIENTCIRCNRLMDKSEVKILPPSYIQEHDQYVSSGVVRRRLMCLGCYNTMKSATKERVRFDRYRSPSRIGTFRTALGRLLAQR